jgi:hypothetical protein
MKDTITYHAHGQSEEFAQPMELAFALRLLGLMEHGAVHLTKQFADDGIGGAGSGRIIGRKSGRGVGYMARHKLWMSRDDHLFLRPEPLTIYTGLPCTEDVVDYYQDCYPGVELNVQFLEQWELKALALPMPEGEE